jgi:hypothetical protein
LTKITYVGTENHGAGQTQIVSPPYTSELWQTEPQISHNVSRTTADPTRPDEELSNQLEGRSGADVNELDLFPEYFSGSVRRDDAGDRRTAAISMEFPRRSIANVDCAMTIEVLPNKVERLAYLLFDAHLETNGEVRELVCSNGLKAIVKQLQGSPPEAFLKVFGPTTSAALQSAPYRKHEVDEAGPRAPTRCVTMSDCSDAAKGAIITLTLGRREASQIYEKLFRSSISSSYIVWCSTTLIFLILT